MVFVFFPPGFWAGRTRMLLFKTPPLVLSGNKNITTRYLVVVKTFVRQIKHLYMTSYYYYRTLLATLLAWVQNLTTIKVSMTNKQCDTC